MRLIDADKLKEAINSSLNTGRETFSPEIIYEAVDEQPTAFDIEDVVAQLKQLKRDKKHDIAYEIAGKVLDRIIEIMEGGGVE